MISYHKIFQKKAWAEYLVQQNTFEHDYGTTLLNGAQTQVGENIAASWGRELVQNFLKVS